MPSERHILVVDDDPIFIRAAHRLLHRAGFLVSTAHHFDAALRILAAGTSVSLLITDIVMPGSVNGLALARMARLRREGIKVIYITGYDIGSTAEREALGPILRKPIDDAVLLDAVNQALTVTAF